MPEAGRWQGDRELLLQRYRVPVWDGGKVLETAVNVINATELNI